MSELHPEEPAGGAGATKGFFAVDRRTFKTACLLGRNAAIAYLILANGTGRDDKTTA